jgi:Xaa-Pro aminopeptidase
MNPHDQCDLLNGPKPSRVDIAVRLTKFWHQMQDRSICILVSNPERTRSNDTEYPYRQSSDVLYLNGFPEPQSVLVVTKLAGRYSQRFIMLVRPKDRAKEVWTGIRAGVDGARKQWGADEAYPIDQFEEVIGKLLDKADAVYYKFGVNEEFDEQFRKVWSSDQKTLLNPEAILHEMRLFKTANEAALLRHACAISAEAHRRAMTETRSGMRERQLQGIIEGVFADHGASGVAYGSIVANGNNACVLHYTENKDVLRDGDLVLVDAACEYEGYASDITRTWPVSGKFTDAQREIYELVLEAQVAAIRAVRPGVKLAHVHQTAQRVLRRGLIKLGILPAEATAHASRKLQSKKAQKAREEAAKGKKNAGAAKFDADKPLELFDFFMHGTSHWMGLDVHDVGSYDEAGSNNNRNKSRKQRKLQPGMVFTVEPGLYFDKDDTRVPQRYRGIGVRIEDDVLVTESGCEVLTAGVPKTVADIEALMAAGR